MQHVPAFLTRCQVRHGVCYSGQEKNNRSSRTGLVVAEEFRQRVLQRSFGDDVLPGGHRISSGAGLASTVRRKKLCTSGTTA